MDIASFIRHVPDYPKPGILFYDITPLLASPEAFGDVIERMADAVAEGASLASAGERNGAFYPPGVLTGVTADSDAYHQELFGPVAMVFKVADEEEAVAVANDTHVAEEDGQWKVTGEPTEGALRTLADKAGFDAGEHERHASIPFESANKFMATLNTVPRRQHRLRPAPRKPAARILSASNRRCVMALRLTNSAKRSAKRKAT